MIGCMTRPLPPNRFAYLMALYAENCLRLERLFDVGALPAGDYRSSVGDGLDVLLTIQVRHAYTVELCLTYALRDPLTGRPDPSAFVRWYGDARMVEATHCYIGRRWQDELGLDADARTVIGHRLRMNVFLSKWLEYLGEQGHSAFTLEALEPDPGAHDQLPATLLAAAN